MRETISSIASFLLENDNYAIGIHANPDGDCFGSACGLASALKKIGKKSIIVSPMEIPKRLQFINYENIPVCQSKEEFEKLPKDGYTFITVDVASTHLLDYLGDFYSANNAFAIDHHESNNLTAKRKYVDSKASAAGEIVYSIITKLEKLTDKVIFDSNIASSVFAAISSDTGCFKYSNVTPKTFNAASNLLKKGARSADVNYRLFDLKSYIQLEVEKLSYSKLEFFYNNALSFIYLSDEDLQSIGAKPSDTENVSQLGRSIEGVQISAYMRKKQEGLYKVSVRSNNDADMSQLCASFGIGGGHKKAAGCSIYADDAETAKNIFIEKAKDYLE